MQDPAGDLITAGTITTSWILQAKETSINGHAKKKGPGEGTHLWIIRIPDLIMTREFHAWRTQPDQPSSSYISSAGPAFRPHLETTGT